MAKTSVEPPNKTELNTEITPPECRLSEHSEEQTNTDDLIVPRRTKDLVKQRSVQFIPLSPFSTRRICSRDAKRKQEFSNVIGWRKSSLLRKPITLPDSCFRFASREQIRLVENGLYTAKNTTHLLQVV